MANSSSKLSSLNVSPMDFPYSIISDQYDLFMNKIIEEMLTINSYNQFIKVVPIIFSFMLPSSKLYLIKLLGCTVYSGNFSVPCIDSAILEINLQNDYKFCQLIIVIRENVKVI